LQTLYNLKAKDTWKITFEKKGNDLDKYFLRKKVKMM